LASKNQYLRRTLLNVGTFTADISSAKVTLSTNNGSNAALSKLPLEFNLAGITSINIYSVKVGGYEKAFNPIPLFSGNGVQVIALSGTTVDIAASGTVVEVFYTVAINEGAQNVSAQVRVPQGANTNFSMGNFDSFGTTGADLLVWSDKAVANTSGANGNWFSSAKVVGLPTSYATVK